MCALGAKELADDQRRAAEWQQRVAALAGQDRTSLLDLLHPTAPSPLGRQV